MDKNYWEKKRGKKSYFVERYLSIRHFLCFLGMFPVFVESRPPMQKLGGEMFTKWAARVK